MGILPPAALACIFGADIDAKDFEGAQPIHYMARKGMGPAILEDMIIMGANITAKDDKGVQPIHISAKQEDYLMLEALIGKGARTNKGMQPIHFAASSGAHDLIEYLLEDLGVDVEAKDCDGKTAVDNEDSAETVRILVDLGATLTSNIAVEGAEGTY
jgi:hypothetical protein